jgi:pilus assembly protein CpaF
MEKRMNLSDRLRNGHLQEGTQAQHTGAAGAVTLPSPAAQSSPPLIGDGAADAAATTTPASPLSQRLDESAASAASPARVAPVKSESDALGRLKDEARAELFTRLGSRLSDTSLSEEAMSDLVRKELGVLVQSSSVVLKPEERRRLINEICDDVLGYGPLQKLLDDDDVTEIMVNGYDHVYVEKEGRLYRSGAQFSSEEHLRRIIERIVSRIGRRIDESSPLVDARLEDGSRVNAVIPPLAFGGSSLTIRKFGKVPLDVHDLVARGSLSPQMVSLLRACVEAKLNILVSGGTGTGKTTLLNVLSSFIPFDERIVTIEDAVELQLQQDHVVRLESRPRNIEGRGEVTIRDLVRNSLRMRPDRIIVGEVRGGESLDMLQAMNTGHEGSLSTLHANTPRDAISRLETMVLMAGMDLPLRAIREQVASALDVIVHLSRLRDGTRRVTHVTEVQGMEGDIITLQDAFVFDYSAGVDANGRYLGSTIATGIRPQFTERFAEMGVPVPAGLFDTYEPARVRGHR